MGQERDAVKTPITAEELREALKAAWLDLLPGQPCKPSSIGVLVAQSAHETGRWKSLYNYNIGNIKARVGGPLDWCFLQTWEMVSIKEADRLERNSTALEPAVVISQDASKNIAKVVLKPKHPGCAFRSYDTLVAGVREYFSLMQTRFRSAWPAVVAGNPDMFAVLLKKANYYTAPEEEYRRALTALFAELSGLPDLRKDEGVKLVLNRLGYDGPLRGQLPQNPGMLGKFQADKRLVVDEIVGPNTTRELRAALDTLEV